MSSILKMTMITLWSSTSNARPHVVRIQYRRTGIMRHNVKSSLYDVQDSSVAQRGSCKGVLPPLE